MMVVHLSPPQHDGPGRHGLLIYNGCLMSTENRGPRPFRYVTDLVQDFRFAVRSHSRKPTLGIAIIAVLSISIGATTAVFSIVNSVLLRPFRIKDHDRMVMISETNPSKGNYEVEASYPNFVSWRERN